MFDDIPGHEGGSGGGEMKHGPLNDAELAQFTAGMVINAQFNGFCDACVVRSLAMHWLVKCITAEMIDAVIDKRDPYAGDAVFNEWKAIISQKVEDQHGNDLEGLVKLLEKDNPDKPKEG